MSAIRSKGNKTTEVRLARLLRQTGVNGWRRHAKLAGTPDFVWHKERVAVFVDGCFWHGCPKCYLSPRHNASFWSEKVLNNRKRDRRVSRLLRSAGWQVVRIWECKIEDALTMQRIEHALAPGATKKGLA